MIGAEYAAVDLRRLTPERLRFFAASREAQSKAEIVQRLRNERVIGA